MEAMGVSVSALGGTLAVGGFLIFLYLKVFRKSTKKIYPRNTVILHNIGRGPYAPSLTPFAVKLETYLRMTKIPYQNENDQVKSSSKGKYPWIEYNGTAVPDSSFAIKYLKKEFNVELDKGFSEQELGAAHAIQKMVDENTYWTTVHDRWLYDTSHHSNIVKLFKIPKIFLFIICRSLRNQAYGHGIGRHSKDEVYEILKDDLTALSNFLGDKKYLLGDKPCQSDCAVFGQLSQIYWNSFGSKSEETLKEFQNLCNYCERIKDTYWPDWEDCTTKGGTAKALK